VPRRKLGELSRLDHADSNRLPAAVAPALAQQTTFTTGLACDWAGYENATYSCFIGLKTSSQLMAAVDTEVDK
jgi:hypothetical protein